jgi:hypothetical protein
MAASRSYRCAKLRLYSPRWGATSRLHTTSRAHPIGIKSGCVWILLTLARVFSENRFQFSGTRADCHPPPAKALSALQICFEWSHFLRRTGIHPGSSPGQAFAGKCSGRRGGTTAMSDGRGLDTSARAAVPPARAQQESSRSRCSSPMCCVVPLAGDRGLRGARGRRACHARRADRRAPDDRFRLLRRQLGV